MPIEIHEHLKGIQHSKETVTSELLFVHTQDEKALIRIKSGPADQSGGPPYSSYTITTASDMLLLASGLVKAARHLMKSEREKLNDTDACS